MWNDNPRLKVSTKLSLSSGTRNEGREVGTELVRAGAVRYGLVVFRGGSQDTSRGGSQGNQRLDLLPVLPFNPGHP